MSRRCSSVFYGASVFNEAIGTWSTVRVTTNAVHVSHDLRVTRTVVPTSMPSHFCPVWPPSGGPSRQRRVFSHNADLKGTNPDEYDLLVSCTLAANVKDTTEDPTRPSARGTQCVSRRCRSCFTWPSYSTRSSAREAQRMSRRCSTCLRRPYST